MRIAVLEDASVELEQLVQLVADITKTDLPEFACEVIPFRTIKTFEESRAVFDLLILDLHLPDGNGLDLARNLRKQYANIGIIIITAYQEHVYDGYEVGAFRFLPKPVQQEKLREAIRLFVQTHYSMRYLLVPTQTEQLVLPLDDIVCIESQGKHSVIYLRDERYYDSKESIAVYAAEIKSQSFFRVHRRYLVNMKHIIRLSDNKITFDMNRCHAEISRRNRAKFDERFSAYLKTL